MKTFITTPAAIEQTKVAFGERIQVRQHEALEQEAREKLMNTIEDHRKSLVAEYPSQIDVKGDPNLPVTYVSYKLSGDTALPVSEEANLDKLFGEARPELFIKERMATEITHPDALIKSIRASGQDPWALLDIKIKPDYAEALAGHPWAVGIKIEQAILPRKNILDKLSEIGSTLSEEARAWVQGYLDKAMRGTLFMRGMK